LRVHFCEPGHTTEWDAYVASHPAATAYHQAGWRRIIERVFGRESFYLLAVDDQRPRGVLPLVRLKSVLFGDFLVSMPYLNYGGILADDDDARGALLDRARSLAAELGVRHVELRHTENKLELPVRTDRISMVLDLPDDTQSLWKSFGSKLRAQIRRPIREKAEARIGGAELVGGFYPIFARKYRQLGVPVYPRRWFDAILLEFPDDASITIVSIEGSPVAAGVVIDYRDTAEVAWAASLREADRLGANMFLYWSMLEAALERGRRVFDFGRTTEGSGTHRFKKQWGTRPVPLYWHYILGTASEMPQLNLDNPKYRRAAALWRKMPLWATNAIGPRLVRNLP